MDKLYVKNLEIYANHGLYESEKKLGQKFLVSLELSYNMKKGAKSNNLEDSINYGVLCNEIYNYFKLESIDLIETVAYNLIEFIFEKYKIIEELKVDIKKPWAPINLPLKTVQVSLSRKKRKIFLGLGSNIGEKEYYIKNAIKKLDELSSVDVLKVSKMYSTKAWGKIDQEDFLNCVIEIESYEEPEDLLYIIQNIENNLGRVRHEKWGPRTIDIDILFINNHIIYNENLIVPHPYSHLRKFVLEPMAEIAPFYTHPILFKSIAQLFEELVRA